MLDSREILDPTGTATEVIGLKKILPVFMTLLLLAACEAAAGESKASDTTPTPPTAQSSGSTAPTFSETSLFTTTEPVSGSSSETSLPAPESTTEESVPETTILPEDYEHEIVKTAEGLIGIDFSEGGTSPGEGFDNSGFIYYVLRKCGYVGCPRQIGEQVEWGENVSFEELKPGDVVYFSTDPGTNRAEFGGIYAGGGIMIYSPYPGEKVKKSDITTNYWVSRFAAALSL